MSCGPSLSVVGTGGVFFAVSIMACLLRAADFVFGCREHLKRNLF
jgi:hypothetical protein